METSVMPRDISDDFFSADSLVEAALTWMDETVESLLESVCIDFTTFAIMVSLNALTCFPSLHHCECWLFCQCLG